jgi:transposase-like protein
VVQEAYVGGVSTRRVVEIVVALGVTGLSRSGVSRIPGALDAEVEAFRCRQLDPAGYPTSGSTPCITRRARGGQVVNMATLVANGVSASGVRSVLGVEVAGAGGDEGAHWLGFVRSLLARGLAGARLVISHAHPGLVAAVEATLLGASWQRCRVHFTRNALALVPKGAQGLVASASGSIFAQPDEASARARLPGGRQSAARFPKAADLLEGDEADLLVHFTFSAAHRRQIRSTDPHDRLNKEWRTDVVGTFPIRASLVRLAGTLLAEQDDGWATGRAYFSAESMARIDAPAPDGAPLAELLMAS